MTRNLHCDATDCLHNNKEKCSANVIQVNGGATSNGSDTYCNSYINSRDSYAASSDEYAKGSFEDSRIDTEFGNDMTADTGDSPKITCTAGKCSYNSRYYCHAKNVDIDSPKEDGSMRCECNTFKPK